MLVRLGKTSSEFFTRCVKALKDIPVLIRDRRKRWRIIIPAVAVVLLAAGLIYYYDAIYVPSQTPVQETLQTTVARRGSIVLSAAGTGTLQAANESSLAFKTSGKVARLYVKVGDQVTAGQFLAELDNASEELQYEQAKQNLDSLTSTTAIGNAQQAMAAASQKVWSAKLQVEYLLSPDVYYWENEIAADQQAIKDAQVAVNTNPSDQAAQAKLKKATDLLSFEQSKLKDAKQNYHDYVLNNFTVSKRDPKTNVVTTEVLWPTTRK